MPVLADQVLNDPATELLLSDRVTDLVLSQPADPVPVLEGAVGGEVSDYLSPRALCSASFPGVQLRGPRRLAECHCG